jgi:hypothetical protein
VPIAAPRHIDSQALSARGRLWPSRSDRAASSAGEAPLGGSSSRARPLRLPADANPQASERQHPSFISHLLETAAVGVQRESRQPRRTVPTVSDRHKPATCVKVLPFQPSRRGRLRSLSKPSRPTASMAAHRQRSISPGHLCGIQHGSGALKVEKLRRSLSTSWRSFASHNYQGGGGSPSNGLRMQLRGRPT